MCPRCGGPVEGCPDPACAEEGVGHHSDPDANCDDDVPLAGLTRRYLSGSECRDLEERERAARHAYYDRLHADGEISAEKLAGLKAT